MFAFDRLACYTITIVYKNYSIEFSGQNHAKFCTHCCCSLVKSHSKNVRTHGNRDTKLLNGQVVLCKYGGGGGGR